MGIFRPSEFRRSFSAGEPRPGWMGCDLVYDGLCISCIRMMFNKFHFFQICLLRPSGCFLYLFMYFSILCNCKVSCCIFNLLTPSTTMTWWIQLLVTACRLASVSPTGDILVLDQNAAVTMTHDRNVMKSGRIEVSTEDVWGDHGGWRVYILVSYCFVVNVAFQFVVTKYRTWVCQSVRKCQGQVQVPFISQSLTESFVWNILIYFVLQYIRH